MPVAIGMLIVVALVLIFVFTTIHAGWEWQKNSHRPDYANDEFGRACYNFWEEAGVYDLFDGDDNDRRY